MVVDVCQVGLVENGVYYDAIDHRAARSIPGGRGETLQVVDIETTWIFDHEDIPQLVRANLLGTMSVQPSNRYHGLAVVGMLAAPPLLAPLCSVPLIPALLSITTKIPRMIVAVPMVP